MPSTEAERRAEERQKNRIRRDWFYREVLPKMAPKQYARHLLKICGEGVKHKWRRYWAARAAAHAAPNVISFGIPRRKLK